MARGNLILGQGAGKLGDVVLFRNAGQQQARAYVSNPKNPKTYKQALQRSKFASVSLAYQYFKLIVDRSTRYSNGRTAYNDFLKNNISVAPYASKSERQEWAGIYALPAQWTLAFGSLARPSVWTPTAVTAAGGNVTAIQFGTSDDLAQQILSYALSAGWIPANPSSAQTFTITPAQLAEALAGAANCHVCLMTSGTAVVGEYSDYVNAAGAKVFELTADVLSEFAANVEITYSTAAGWSCLLNSTTINGVAGGTFITGDGTTGGEPSGDYVQIQAPANATNGLTFGSWIGNNSGTAVQVSNIILETAGTNINATATKRRDETEPETDAAIASWQMEAAAGSDSAIY